MGLYIFNERTDILSSKIWGGRRKVVISRRNTKNLYYRVRDYKSYI